MGWWLLGVVAIVAAVVFLTPVRVRVSLSGEGKLVWRAELVWLGGLVRLDLRRSTWSVGPWCGGLPLQAGAQAGGQSVSVDSSAPAGWRTRVKSGKFFFQERRVFGRFLRDGLAAIALSARGDFRYGFDDPAVTAWVQVVFCLAGEAGVLRGINARPDFVTAGWSGSCEALATVRPYRMLGPAVRLLGVLAVGQAVEKYRGGRGRWQMQG